jgi:hypothetical protein
MLILNPRQLLFSNQPWPNVTAVSVDRKTTRLALNWSDAGPHPTFADAPEQEITITVQMELDREDLDTPRPGQSGTLTFITSPTSSDANRRQFSTTAVITNITHDLSQRKAPTRTITLLALSQDGATDPITIADA